MEEKREYRNQNIEQTIFINETLYVNPTLLCLEPPYILKKYEFDKLINGNTSLNVFKKFFISICIGFFINIVAKFIGNKIDPRIPFDMWEIYAFIISLGFSIMISIVDIIKEHCFPSERTKIVQIIKKHFNI